MSHRDDASSSSFKLILPDLSGIAQLVDDFSLPTLDTSLREIVSAHEEHAQTIQRTIHQMMEDQEKFLKQLKKISNKIDIISNRVDNIENRLIAIESIKSTNTTTESDDLIVVDSPVINSPLLINSPISTYEPEMIDINPIVEPISDNQIDNDVSELPKVYYTVNPTFGDEAIDTQGKIVIKGNRIKMIGKLTIPNKYDGELFFDNLLGGYFAKNVEYCNISYADKIINQISLEELNNARIKLSLTEVEDNSFPLELSYRIEYTFDEK